MQLANAAVSLILLFLYFFKFTSILSGQVLLDVQVGTEIAEQYIELSVAVVVGHGNLRADAGLGVLAGFKDFAIADARPMWDR